MPAFLLPLDSVKAPEAFREYCRENQDTWVFDRGKRKFVFCAGVLKQRWKHLSTLRDPHIPRP